MDKIQRNATIICSSIAALAGIFIITMSLFIYHRHRTQSAPDNHAPEIQYTSADLPDGFSVECNQFGEYRWIDGDNNTTSYFTNTRWFNYHGMLITDRNKFYSFQTAAFSAIKEATDRERLTNIIWKTCDE